MCLKGENSQSLIVQTTIFESNEGGAGDKMINQ